MSRESTIPQRVLREDIRSIQEFPPTPGEPGRLFVQVGQVDADGAFIVPQQFLEYEINGDHFNELTGEPTPWAPDKPAGTYRNADLWHFVDLQRSA